MALASVGSSLPLRAAAASVVRVRHRSAAGPTKRRAASSLLLSPKAVATELRACLLISDRRSEAEKASPSPKWCCWCSPATKAADSDFASTKGVTKTDLDCSASRCSTRPKLSRGFAVGPPNMALASAASRQPLWMPAASVPRARRRSNAGPTWRSAVSKRPLSCKAEATERRAWLLISATREEAGEVDFACTCPFGFDNVWEGPGATNLAHAASTTSKAIGPPDGLCGGSPLANANSKQPSFRAAESVLRARARRLPRPTC
mmetsp:Transcript_11634/g.29344  ORF Transcript_11634/g.29344 Transcript_11634/m.29344 type:complete len:262 (+) Transcript_11634:2136-2921(+)